MGPYVGELGVLRFVAGTAFVDSWQFVDDDGHSLVAASDTFALVVRRVQGSEELFSFPLTNLQLDGHADLVIGAESIAAIRTALNLPDLALGRCSCSVRRTRAGVEELIAWGVLELEPEA